jgi:hypothetical protein
LGKAIDHAKSSAKQFGGKYQDYLEVHNLIDSSRAVIGDVRHRMLTHNTWFTETVLPRIFGESVKNSEGKRIPIRSIAERHILEDYGDLFVPTPQDFAESIPLAKWMNNAEEGEVPPSRKMMAGEKPVAPIDSSKYVIDEQIVKKVKETLDDIPRRRRSFSDRPCARAGRGAID